MTRMQNELTDIFDNFNFNQDSQFYKNRINRKRYQESEMVSQFDIRKCVWAGQMSKTF